VISDERFVRGRFSGLATRGGRVVTCDRRALDLYHTPGVDVEIIGPLGGSLMVFATPRAAHAFVAGDPFVTRGLAVARGPLTWHVA